MEKKIAIYLVPGVLRYEIEPFHLVEKISMIRVIPLKHFLTKTTPRELRDVRYMTYFLLKKHHNLTLEEIGEIFGRKHGSVLHGIKKFRELKESNTKFRNIYNSIIFELSPRLK